MNTNVGIIPRCAVTGNWKMALRKVAVRVLRSEIE